MNPLLDAGQTTFCALEKQLRETIKLQKEVINLLTNKVQKLTEKEKNLPISYAKSN